MTNTRRSYGSGSLTQEERANGRKVWVGRWRADGREVCRTLGEVRPQGTRDGLTKAMAEKVLREAMAQKVEPLRERVTLSQAIDSHLAVLEDMKDRKARTVSDYRIIARLHLVPFFEDVPLSKVTPDKVEKFMRHQLAQGLKRGTIDNQVNFLHAVMQHAVKKRWVATNPVAQAERFEAKKQDDEIRFLSLEEVEALLRAFPDDDFGRTDRALVLTAALTGLRLGELRALRWSDVDWVAGKVRVERAADNQNEVGTPKSRSSRRAVPMHDRVAGELDRHSKASAYTHDGDLVFCHPHTGEMQWDTSIRERYTKAIKAAGMTGRRVRIHDLRHTFGTQMAAAGVPIIMVSAWMGHADIKTTTIYAKYAPSEHERDMVNRVKLGANQTVHAPV